jgi:ankyrin repeat protein
MLASREGHAGTVRWLLDTGAAIDQRDARGWSPLGLQAIMATPPVMRVLVEREADPTTASTWGSSAPAVPSS